MHYSSLMSSGLRSIAPRHQRSRSVNDMRARPLPPTPAAHPYGHARTASLTNNSASEPSGSQQRLRLALPRSSTEAGPSRTSGGSEAAGSISRREPTPETPDADSSYLSFDDDSDLDSPLDELDESAEMTFIDLNDSTSSLPLPQEKPAPQVQPDIQPGDDDKSPPALLRNPFSEAADSPVLALPSQHFLPSAQPASRPRKSSVLESPSQVTLPAGATVCDVALQMSQDSRRDWREIVDNLMEDDTK